MKRYKIMIMSLIVFSGLMFCIRLSGIYVTTPLGFVVWADYVSVDTPNGTPVEALSMDEGMTPTEKTYWNNSYTSTYPQATIIGSSTTTYNCHSYAWNITEGGDYVWINESPDLHYYWDDGSYVETTQALGDKVYYNNSDHSSIKSKTVSGMYESKWHDGPIMRHPIGYGPYSNMSTRKYYAKPPQISGHNIVTNTVSSTFTLAFSPLNYTINWVFNSSLFSAVGSTTGSSVTIKAKSSSVVGVGTLTAQFKRNGQVVATSTYAIYANRLPTQSTPSLRVVRSSDGVQAYPGSVGLCPNTYYYGYLTGTYSSYNYTWDMNHASVYSSSYNQAYFQTDSQGWTFLDLYATDPTTGVTQQVYSVTLYDGYSCN